MASSPDAGAAATPDGALVAARAAGWGMAAAAVEFLPVGDDARAWSYRVVDGDGVRRFLKVRRGPVDPATVLVPAYLRDHGLEQVVAAVPPWTATPGGPLATSPCWCTRGSTASRPWSWG